MGLPSFYLWGIEILFTCGLFDPTDDWSEDVPRSDLDPGRPAIFGQLTFGDLLFDMGLYLSGLNQSLGDIRQRCSFGRNISNAVYHGEFLACFRVCLGMG